MNTNTSGQTSVVEVTRHNFRGFVWGSALFARSRDAEGRIRVRTYKGPVSAVTFAAGCVNAGPLKVRTTEGDVEIFNQAGQPLPHATNALRPIVNQDEYNLLRLFQPPQLYVWTNVIEDYTSGIMFALAHSADEARELIAPGYAERKNNSSRNGQDQDLDREPEIVTSSRGYAVWGGG